MSKFFLDQKFLKNFKKLGIAFSGGLDSSVLLKLITENNESIDQLTVLHINHNINKQSDSWELFCKERASELGIDFISWKLESSDKISEELLRDKRHEAFKEWADEKDLILTGHHLDDQIETVIFRIFRGTGLRGLEGIKEVSKINDLNFYRPLLNCRKEDLLQYAHDKGLSWIEDDSNKESYFARNIIRNEVMPKITERWPAIDKAIGHLSSRASKADKILSEVAQEDFMNIDGSTEALDIVKLQSFSYERQENLIFHWLTHINNLNISSGQRMQILSSIINPSEGSISFSANSRSRDLNIKILISHEEVRILDDTALIPLPNDTSLEWNLRDTISIPSGKLSLVESPGKGLDKKFLEQGATIKARVGGERCKPFGRHKSQKIKNLFQEFKIPDWKRDFIPLIYIGDRIAAVGDLWVCEEFHTSIEEKGMSIIWNQNQN